MPILPNATTNIESCSINKNRLPQRVKLLKLALAAFEEQGIALTYTTSVWAMGTAAGMVQEAASRRKRSRQPRRSEGNDPNEPYFLWKII